MPAGQQANDGQHAAPGSQVQQQLAAAPAAMPGAAGPAAGGGIAGRRKKVIRSRIGYARTAAPAEQPTHASNLADALGGGSRAATPTAAAAAAAKDEPTPAGQVTAPLSDAGSEGGDSNAPAAGASRAASAGDGSRPGSRSSAEHLQRQTSGDPQHLTARQHPAPRLDIRLELPARPADAAQRAQRPQHSSDSGSRRSTSACRGEGRGQQPGRGLWQHSLAGLRVRSARCVPCLASLRVRPDPAATPVLQPLCSGTLRRPGSWEQRV